MRRRASRSVKSVVASPAPKRRGAPSESAPKSVLADDDALFLSALADQIALQLADVRARGLPADVVDALDVAHRRVVALVLDQQQQQRHDDDDDAEAEAEAADGGDAEQEPGPRTRTRTPRGGLRSGGSAVPASPLLAAAGPAVGGSSSSASGLPASVAALSRGSSALHEPLGQSTLYAWMARAYEAERRTADTALELARQLGAGVVGAARAPAAAAVPAVPALGSKPAANVAPSRALSLSRGLSGQAESPALNTLAISRFADRLPRLLRRTETLRADVAGLVVNHEDPRSFLALLADDLVGEVVHYVRPPCLWLAGGGDPEGGACDRVMKWDLNTQSVRWMNLPTLIDGCSGINGALLNGAFVLVGGEKAGSYFPSVKLFSERQHGWRWLPSLSVARWGHNVETVDSVLFALGGCTIVPHDEAEDGDAKIISSSVEILRPDGVEWKSAAPMPFARSLMASAAHGTNIYAIGGEDEHRYYCSTRVLDTVTDHWHSVSVMDSSASCCAAFTYEGCIYVTGGARESALADFRRFDPRMDRWESLAQMNHARYDHVAAACPSGSRLLVAGGRNSPGWAANLDSIEEYDPRRDQWEISPAVMPEKLSKLAGLIF